MDSIIFKTSVPSLVLVLVLVIGFGALTTAQQTGVPPVLYLTIFNGNLEAWSSFSTYNPNILSGGMGGSFYGLVWAYSAILNVSNNQMLPIIFTNWTISPANWEQVWQNESISITISMVHSGWSNGTPLTAWDVVATCYWLDMLGAPPYYNFYVINNYTFIMSVPKGLFSPYNLPFTLLNTVGLGEVAITIPYSAWKPIIQQIVGNCSIIQTGK